MKTLVIPDLHHRLDWVERILNAEHGGFDRVVFLGDYFDAYKPEFSATKVARFLLGIEDEIEQREGRRIPTTFLVGNHDYQYAMLEHTMHPPREPWAVPGGCSSYSKTRAQDVNAVLRGTGFWDRCEVATEVGGYLVSHAGVLPHLWPYTPAGAFSLDEIEAVVRGEVEAFLRMAQGVWRERFALRGHALFNCSRAKRRLGGESWETGIDESRPPAGLLWCDWREEFLKKSAIPLPQIIGHTGPAPGEEAARRKDRSWCIDGAQTVYALIHGGAIGSPGEVEVKRA